MWGITKEVLLWSPDELKNRQGYILALTDILNGEFFEEAQ